jgi:hypothetical protein
VLEMPIAVDQLPEHVVDISHRSAGSNNDCDLAVIKHLQHAVDGLAADRALRGLGGRCGVGRLAVLAGLRRSARADAAAVADGAYGAQVGSTVADGDDGSFVMQSIG